MQPEKLVSLLAACALVAGGVAIVAPAVAKEPPLIVTAPPDVPTRYVSYRDLDLRSSSGEKILVRRVGLAVKHVCSEALGPSPIYYADVGCRRDSWSDARPQIDRAVRRSRDIASMGWSSIPPVAITVSAF